MTKVYLNLIGLKLVPGKKVNRWSNNGLPPSALGAGRIRVTSAEGVTKEHALHVDETGTQLWYDDAVGATIVTGETPTAEE